MKKFVLTRKKIILLLVIFISLIFSFIILKKLLVFSSKDDMCAVEVNSNSILVNGFQDVIQNLTSREEKVAYLTFDDGPNISVTPKVLDILKKEDVKATFFVIGKYVYEEGHYIANHSYSHNNDILYKTEENFKDEINKTDSAIAKAIGKEKYCSYVFRFPNGYMSANNKSKKKKMLEVLSKMNYAYIDWNCLNNDSMKKYSSDELLRNLKKSAENKNTLVVLMHDTKDVSNSSNVLQESIEYLKSKGYRFENFYDLMKFWN